MGVQEPASAIFSILNLCTNFYGWKRYTTLAQTDPFYNLWLIQAILSLNAWFWSAVFHVHDIPLTEVNKHKNTMIHFILNLLYIWYSLPETRLLFSIFCGVVFTLCSHNENIQPSVYYQEFIHIPQYFNAIFCILHLSHSLP